MNKKFIQEYEFLKFNFSNIPAITEIVEIRFIKVLKKNKLKYIKIPYSLLFLSNDWTDFTSYGIKEDSLIFYSIRTKQDKNVLLGILIEYLKNGTKNEKPVYYNIINKIYYKLLISKYDMTWEY